MPAEFSSKIPAILGSLAAALLLTAVNPSVAGAEDFPQRVEEVAALFSQGRFDEADLRAVELLARAESQFGKSSAEVARVLDHLVRIRYRNGGRRELLTLGYARRSVAIWESFAPGSDEHASGLHWLAAIAESRGRLNDAEDLYRRSLEMRKSLYGDRHPSIAQSLDFLGSLLLGRAGDDAGLRAEAEQMQLRALSLREELVGPDSLETAESCNSLVVLYFNLGDYELARAYAQRSLEIRESLLDPKHPLVGRSWHNLAVMDHKLGRIAEARTAIERALELRTAALGEDHPEVGSSHSSLASLLRDTGDFTRAEEHYRAALKPMGKGYGEDHSFYATVLSNLALLLEHRGDLEAARELQQRSLEIRRGTGREGKTLAWLGRLELRLGNPREGLSLLRRGLTLQERRQGKTHPDLVDTLVYLAKIELAEGKLGRAEELYRRGAAILEAADREHPGLVEIYLHLSKVRQLRGREAEPLDLAVKARRILAAHFGPDHPQNADALLRLAEVSLAGGDAEPALRHALEAHEISRNHLRSTGRFLPERAALAYLSSLKSGLDLALSVLATASPRGTEEAWDVLIGSRASVLDEVAWRSRALHLDSTEASARLMKRQADAYRRLTNLTTGNGLGISQETRGQQIRQARQQAEAAEAELARLAASSAQDPQPESPTLTEVRDALGRDSALIAYVVFERRRPWTGDRKASPPSAAGGQTYGAFVLPPAGREPSFSALAEAAIVDQAIADLGESARRALKGTEREELAYRQVGERLRRLLWDPIADLVSGAETVFVVPDGNLALMSFSALPEAHGGYLMESGSTLHVLTAERDLLRPAEGVRGKGILLVGGVNFDARQMASKPSGHGQAGSKTVLRSARSACLDEGLPYFEPLPETYPEVSEIQRLLTSRRLRQKDGKNDAPITLLSGTRAEEGVFKRMAPGQSILHVSTHGFFYGGECGKDLIGAEGERTRSLLGNPLATSGLAFAGANSRQVTSADTEDGILTAEEVATLDLQGVSWVVLSACETAQGRAAAGEGVLGLRRAFRIAGAETVIMSLWPVEDTRTREWMEALYSSRLDDAASTAEAVRSASLSILEKLRREGASTHPVFWANFVASGVWR